MQFDSDPSREPDPVPNHIEYSEFTLHDQVEDGLPLTVFRHSSGIEVRVYEVSPDRLLFKLPDSFTIKEFLFDRYRYEEGTEEHVYHALAETLTSRHAVPQDLSQASLSASTTCSFPDISAHETVQATQVLLGRVETLLGQSQSPRERVVLQRFERELTEAYEREYGATARRYIEADQVEELESDSLYLSFIHYTSLEDICSMFQRASVVPLFEVDDPKALDHVLDDLKRFQESSLEPKLFHDSFMMSMAAYFMEGPAEEEEPQRPSFGGGGGFIFPDDDFID